MKDKVLLFLFVMMWITTAAQVNDGTLPAKVSHAEPIYFDLIRDLGARKGERELNIGMGIASHTTYSEYSYLIEYEFAPVNRLGVEIEIPFAFHGHNVSDDPKDVSNGIEGAKAALQYSFFVSEKLRTTMAVGYIFEKRLTRMDNAYAHTPFLIIGKRIGRQFHSLLYTGPLYEWDRRHGLAKKVLINASAHYTLPGTKNFVGVEINDELTRGTNTLVVRPQIKMTMSSSSSIGIALGVAGNHHDVPLDFLLRWIYEPRKKN